MDKLQIRTPQAGDASGHWAHDQTPTLNPQKCHQDGTRFMGAWGSAAPSLGGSSEPKGFISKTMFPGGRVVGRMVLVPSYCLSTPPPKPPEQSLVARGARKRGRTWGAP